ncbi:MAG: IS66-like element accessory protein TnpA [Hyphomicrobiaceae bacterium]
MVMSGDNFERQFEIVADTRRRWSREEKLAIVKEASVPCTNVSAVARRHGIKPALLYRWKKELSGKAAPALLPVTISELCDDKGEPHPLPAKAKACVVEIALGNGRMVRVPADIEAGTLGRIIGVLEG